MDAAEAAFLGRVRAAVHFVLRKCPATFQEILTRTWNCDPALLFHVLCLEQERGLIREALYETGPCFYSTTGEWRSTSSVLGAPSADCFGAMEHQSRLLRSSIAAILHGLPEPSPVYSQWWFSASAYSGMLSVLNNLARNAHDVAFLGCPSIGALFSQVSRSRVTLFDVDCELLRTLESHCSPAVMLVEYDVAFDVPQELQDHYGFVFSDPPWGTRLLQGFLARTAQLTRAGGFAAITLPQALTRPGLADEVKTLVETARGLGLRLEGRVPRATEYGIPEFERSAYAATGLDIASPWRHGDLFIFRKASNCAALNANVRLPARQEWEQISLGRQRVFLSCERGGAHGWPELRPPAGCVGFVCPTTSSRVPAMRDAVLVSTRNEVARVDCAAGLPGLLREYASRTQNGDRPWGTNEREGTFADIQSFLRSRCPQERRCASDRGREAQRGS